MKYAVEQKYYNSGRHVEKILKVNDNEESFTKERLGCDYYFDVFDTQEEAEDFLKECEVA